MTAGMASIFLPKLDRNNENGEIRDGFFKPMKPKEKYKGLEGCEVNGAPCWARTND